MPEQRHHDVDILDKLGVQRSLRSDAVLSSRMQLPVHRNDHRTELLAVDDIPAIDRLLDSREIVPSDVTR